MGFFSCFGVPDSAEKMEERRPLTGPACRFYDDAIRLTPRGIYFGDGLPDRYREYCPRRRCRKCDYYRRATLPMVDKPFTCAGT